MTRSPNTPKPASRASTLTRVFFSFSEPAKTPSGWRRKETAKAPKGYAFNKRGDLVSLRREALRRGE